MKQEENPTYEEAKREVEIMSPLRAYRESQKMNLTKQEEIFCKEYSVHKDIKKAVVAAGYTGNHPGEIGRRWFQRSRIQRRINTLLERDQFRADLTREKYHQKLQDIYDKAMGDGDYSGANRAMELLGKSLGFFVEQKAILNVTSKLQGDKAQEVEEVKRLAKIAGVTLE